MKIEIFDGFIVGAAQWPEIGLQCAAGEVVLYDLDPAALPKQRPQQAILHAWWPRAT
jgi:hypothetical protein